MISLFGPRLPIDRDELDWQLATFKWLIGEFGGVEARPLVLPTGEWFPPTERKGEGRVAELFEHVKRAASMSDWACDLKAGRGDRPIHAGNALLLQHEGASPPCGTFEIIGEDGLPRVVITYNPDLAADTTALIATFAHELGHYLLSKAGTAPPGGWELHELHTDVAGVYLGFGIFLANSAKSFSQYQSAGEMGWSSRTQGYLSEGALVTALAVFQRLRGADPLAASPWLKDYLETDMRRAAKGLAKLHPDVPASVAAVDLADFAAD